MPNASKQAGAKRKRAPSTRYTSNKGLPSWKSDQPTAVLRAPANPMVQPQRAAPPADHALQIIHGDNDCMQGQGLRGADDIALDHARHGQAEASGHLTEKVLRITQRCPLAGLKADSVANQGSVREKAILGNGVVHVCFHPKDANDATKGVVAGRRAPPRTTNKIAVEEAWHCVNANPASADDVSFSYRSARIKARRSTRAYNTTRPRVHRPGDGPRFAPAAPGRGRGRSPVPDSHPGGPRPGRHDGRFSSGLGPWACSMVACSAVVGF
jgi:hypothetical protein